MTSQRKLEVKKSELLEVLKKNKELHLNEFQEAQEEYNDACTKKLEELLEESKKRKRKVNTSVDLYPPQSYLKEYEDIIGMLEFSTQDTIEITMDEYKSWVKNEWKWSQSFAMTKLSYAS